MNWLITREIEGSASARVGPCRLVTAIENLLQVRRSAQAGVCASDPASSRRRAHMEPSSRRGDARRGAVPEKTKTHSFHSRRSLVSAAIMLRVTGNRPRLMCWAAVRVGY